MTKRYPVVYINGFPTENPATDTIYGGGRVDVSATAPTSPQDGDMWYDTTNGVLKVYISSSTSWVNTSGALFKTGVAPSTGMEEGDFWYNSTSTTQPFSMYIGTSWVGMSGTSGGGGGGGSSISEILAFGF